MMNKVVHFRNNYYNLNKRGSSKIEFHVRVKENHKKRK